MTCWTDSWIYLKATGCPRIYADVAWWWTSLRSWGILVCSQSWGTALGADESLRMSGWISLGKLQHHFGEDLKEGPVCSMFDRLNAPNNFAPNLKQAKQNIYTDGFSTSINKYYRQSRVCAWGRTGARNKTFMTRLIILTYEQEVSKKDFQSAWTLGWLYWPQRSHVSSENYWTTCQLNNKMCNWLQDYLKERSHLFTLGCGHVRLAEAYVDSEHRPEGPWSCDGINHVAHSLQWNTHKYSIAFSFVLVLASQKGNCTIYWTGNVSK